MPEGSGAYSENKKLDIVIGRAIGHNNCLRCTIYCKDEVNKMIIMLMHVNQIPLYTPEPA